MKNFCDTNILGRSLILDQKALSQKVAIHGKSILLFIFTGFAIYFLYGIRHSVAPWKSGYQIRRSGYETIDSSDKNPPNRDDTSLKESYGTI